MAARLERGSSARTMTSAMPVRQNRISNAPIGRSSRTAIAMVENESTAPLIHSTARNATGSCMPLCYVFFVKPPFRADQVGSLLRPEELKQAREKHLGPQTPTSSLGPHGNEELRKVEDRCIREVIAMQERAGLCAHTDGEFRRRSWWLELIMGWQGFAADRTGSAKLAWRNEQGVQQGFSDLNVTGRIKWRPSSVVRAFEFLKNHTKAVPKVTMPAPNCVHYFTHGKLGFYKDADEFWDDLLAAYRKEIAELIKAGARYLQFDDTSIAFICDPEHR